MEIKLTTVIGNDNVIVVPLGGEAFSNKDLEQHRRDADAWIVWEKDESIYPVGISGQKGPYVIVIDLIKKENISFNQIRKIYGRLIRCISLEHRQKTTIIVPKINGFSQMEMMEAIIEGIQLGSYQFDKYKRKVNPPLLNKDYGVSLFIDEPSLDPAYNDSLQRMNIITDGIKLARDLINEPGNELTPQLFIEKILTQTLQTDIEMQVFDEIEMAETKRTGILSVGKGSTRPPRLCILKYTSDPCLPIIALVGKGITTDLGGINLKIGNDLSLARTDMGGAAVVVGVLKIIEALGIKANLYGIIPIAENICDGGALKPGEIIEYKNGKTVEIKNTDAEGRLILADGLIIAREFKADIIIDIATLTGSCAMALGSQIAGILGVDPLVDLIMESGRKCGENFWKLPLFEEYGKELESDIADISNFAVEEPGVITAALFLKEFAGDSNWAHIDIAGTRNAKTTEGHIIRGGTGFGVKTLVTFIEGLCRSPDKLTPFQH